jgi:hypothetical protein
VVNTSNTIHWYMHGILRLTTFITFSLFCNWNDINRVPCVCEMACSQIADGGGASRFGNWLHIYSVDINEQLTRSGLPWQCSLLSFIYFDNLFNFFPSSLVIYSHFHLSSMKLYICVRCYSGAVI